MVHPPPTLFFGEVRVRRLACEQSIQPRRRPIRVPRVDLVEHLTESAGQLGESRQVSLSKFGNGRRIDRERVSDGVDHRRAWRGSVAVASGGERVDQVRRDKRAGVDVTVEEHLTSHAVLGIVVTVKTHYTSDALDVNGHSFALRPAVIADCGSLASIWFSGWRDGHLGHVPATLHRHRRLVDFQRRVPARLEETTVATVDSKVVGFVMVHEDEIEQIYVDERARGTGVATALLEHGRHQILDRSDGRFEVAWLAVAAGNGRARRFYERNGWTDGGPLDYAAHIDGGTIIVPTRRYEKR